MDTGYSPFMARIELMGTIPSHLGPVDLLNQVVNSARMRGIEVIQTAPNQAEFRRGSQAALRIKGALFTRLDQFPVVAVIRCDQTPTGSNAVINSLDELIVGLRFGMRGKYTEAVRDFGAFLSTLIGEVNAGTSPHRFG
ncbi:MAG: hypothetical protein RL430_1285 [Actinomycetota bacterium]|jgi:hypothetical protein